MKKVLMLFFTSVIISAQDSTAVDSTKYQLMINDYNKNLQTIILLEGELLKQKAALFDLRRSIDIMSEKLNQKKIKSDKNKKATK